MPTATTRAPWRSRPRSSRKLGRADGRGAALDRLLEFDPLDHLARFERYLLDPTAARLAEFKSMIRNELPHESYLEMAIFYVRIGRTEDAVTLLENAPEQPEVEAWLAYLLKERDPGRSKAHLDKAIGPLPSSRLPVPRGVHPGLRMGRRGPAAGMEAEVLSRPDPVGERPDRRSAGISSPAATAPISRPSSWPGAISRRRARRKRPWRTSAGPSRSTAGTGASGTISPGPSKRSAGRARPSTSRPRRPAFSRRKCPSSLTTSGPCSLSAGTTKRRRSWPGSAPCPTRARARSMLSMSGPTSPSPLDRMGRGDWTGAVDALERSKLYPENLGTGAPARTRRQAPGLFRGRLPGTAGEQRQSRRHPERHPGLLARALGRARARTPISAGSSSSGWERKPRRRSSSKRLRRPSRRSWRPSGNSAGERKGTVPRGDCPLIKLESFRIFT